MASDARSKLRKVSAGCAAALAVTVGLAGPAAPAAGAMDQMQRYCLTSWRNAGIHPQDWEDCTQEAIARLLERVSQDRLDAALSDPESPERRELKRAIWRTTQRWRRAPRLGPLDGQFADHHDAAAATALRDAIEVAARSLSPRQQEILTLWSQGWSVHEIAGKLGIPAACVSDGKYKAIRKLRAALAPVV